PASEILGRAPGAMSGVDPPDSGPLRVSMLAERPSGDDRQSSPLTSDDLPPWRCVTVLEPADPSGGVVGAVPGRLRALRRGDAGRRPRGPDHPEDRRAAAAPGGEARVRR